ncbi:hypothetical protein GQ53DRAFT_460969 [Thozetella sp. PMI_491]|nr:hypothetical protein GQ53DRAFT_460969 [Thozetella sp. PMI_491]
MKMPSCGSEGHGAACERPRSRLLRLSQDARETRARYLLVICYIPQLLIAPPVRPANQPAASFDREIDESRGSRVRSQPCTPRRALQLYSFSGGAPNKLTENTLSRAKRRIGIADRLVARAESEGSCMAPIEDDWVGIAQGMRANATARRLGQIRRTVCVAPRSSGRFLRQFASFVHPHSLSVRGQEWPLWGGSPAKFPCCHAPERVRLPARCNLELGQGAVGTRA